MSAAKVDPDGIMETLDGKAGPPEVVTSADVADPEKLARRLQQAYSDIAELKRRYNPKVVYHWDRVVDDTTTTKFRFEHGLGRINWYIVRWKTTSGSGTPPYLDEHGDTDADALVLISGNAGTVSIRIEGAG